MIELRNYRHLIEGRILMDFIDDCDFIHSSDESELHNKTRMNKIHYRKSLLSRQYSL